MCYLNKLSSRRDNGTVHRAAAKIIVSKSRAARGSVCNVLLSRPLHPGVCIAKAVVVLDGPEAIAATGDRQYRNRDAAAWLRDCCYLKIAGVARK